MLTCSRNVCFNLILHMFYNKVVVPGLYESISMFSNTFLKPVSLFYSLWKEVVVQRCSMKNVFFEISQNPRKNNSSSATCNFIKKEILAQVFSCEFCEISKNTFFIEHLWWLLLHGVSKCNIVDTLKNFARFTVKQLCQSIIFNVADKTPATLLDKRLWQKCFPVNFVKLNNSFTEYLWTTASRFD